jgi:hypothetical protein
MSEELIPIIAAVSVVIFKIGEIMFKKTYGTVKYKKVKKNIYNTIENAFQEQNIETLKEGLDLLKDFDIENDKEKLPKMLEKLKIDPEKINTLEELAEQFEEMNNKVNEKSIILDQFDEYFDNIKRNFMEKIKNDIIKE